MILKVARSHGNVKLLLPWATSKACKRLGEMNAGHRERQEAGGTSHLTFQSCVRYMLTMAQKIKVFILGKEKE